MGLFSDIVGGIFGLAGAAIGAGVGAVQEASAQKKLEDELQSNQEIIENHRLECLAMTNKIYSDTRLELYAQGLEYYSNFAIDFMSNDRSLYIEHIAGIEKVGKDVSLNDIYNYVSEKWNTFFFDKRKNENVPEYDNAFKIATDNTIIKIKNKIISKLSCSEYDGFVGLKLDYYDIVNLLYSLIVLTNDTGYIETINALDNYNKQSMFIFIVLQEIEYGNFELVDFDDSNMNIQEIEQLNQSMKQHITDNNTGYFEGIINNLNETFLFNLAHRMWFYANKTPFEREKFDDAVAELNLFIGATGEPLECILAEIYMKNKLGGEDLVCQNIDDIMKQVEVSPVYAQSVCSFLAWIGAYNVEYQALQLAVASKIQLTDEMQDRLSFLTKGGTSSKIKIYDVDTNISSDFIYDGSTVDWSTEEFDALISKFTMKGKRLNYSLVIKSWKKALPLVKGKKFSYEALKKEFRSMVEDFDNEVIYKVKDACAINMDDVKYPECSLFEFTSERNKGITILFSCEKFGRNLNLNIMTMFTPNAVMTQDEMSRCIKSIMINSYVDSFTESILQCLDESLKEPENIYDDAPSPKIFE